MTFLQELKRRGVLGALIAYGVAAAGGLQLADIVVHAMDLPPWTMRALIWISAIGLPVTFVVSWFYDLTRHGFVRTELPATPQRMVTPQATPGNAPKTGALLAGRYLLEKELGAGGMGKVYAALDQRLGRRVAVKVVLGAHEPARVQRFEQEARSAGALEHPNVLAVYDLGEHEGVPFLVTELLDGHTLRTVLASGPLPADQATALGQQLARGLAAAHARGVVHRDLKPENLFVTHDGRLKILDFGLAKLVSSDGDTQPGSGLTQTGAIFGTPGYISPEQARGEVATAASDVFAAGAVLYESLSGKRAFPGDSLIEAGHAALTSEPPPLPPVVPASLDGIVRRAIEKDPQRRYKDGGELAKALESPGTITPATIVTHAPVARRTYSRSTTLALAGAGLAIGAVIASAALVGKRQEKRKDKWQDRIEAQFPNMPRPPVPPNFKIQGLPQPPPDEADDDEQTPPPTEIPANPTRAGEIGIIRGARSLAAIGQTDRAIEMLDRWLQGHPDSAYAQLHRVALLRRAGRMDEAKRAAASAPAGEEWPGPLLHLYAGTQSRNEVLAAVGRDPNRRSRYCEAFFYMGLWDATANPPDKKRAQQELEAAISQRTNDVEQQFAREELQRLQQ